MLEEREETEKEMKEKKESEEKAERSERHCCMDRQKLKSLQKKCSIFRVKNLTKIVNDQSEILLGACIKIMDLSQLGYFSLPPRE